MVFRGAALRVALRVSKLQLCSELRLIHTTSSSDLVIQSMKNHTFFFMPFLMLVSVAVSASSFRPGQTAPGVDRPVETGLRTALSGVRFCART